MLKQRIITALLLAPIVIGLVVWGQPWAVMGLFALIQTVCNYEWMSMNQIDKKSARNLAVVPTAMTLLLWFQWPEQAPLGYFLLPVMAVIWGAALWWLVNYRRGTGHPVRNAVIKNVAGLLALALMMLSVLHINTKSDGNWWLLILLFIIWVADIGAYFSGKTFGKNKLAVNISPGKTWEGVIGAQLFVAILALLVAHWMDVQWHLLILIFPLVALFSVAGDLTASLGKRQAGVKDSSQLLPGHGGFIDRFDSLIAAAPLYALLMFGL